MKKLLMFAAAMTIVGGAYAANCGQTVPGISCEYNMPVWDFKASGKTANTVQKGYKAVQSVKLAGFLVGEMDQLTCCLMDDPFHVFIFDKADKSLVYYPGTLGKMTVFGKNLDKDLKQGKSASVESDVLWTIGGDGDPVELQFVGFGKGKRYITKDQEVNCGQDIVGCEEQFLMPNWTGWFTGWYGEDNNDYEDLICLCSGNAVAGGTWSAKLNKKLTTATENKNVDAALRSIANQLESKFKGVGGLVEFGTDDEPGFMNP